MNLASIADKVNFNRSLEKENADKFLAEQLAQSDEFRALLLSAANRGFYAVSLLELQNPPPRESVESELFQRTMRKYLKPFGAKISGFKVSWY